MEVKILGTGCKNCKTLEARVRRVVETNAIEANIIKIEDIAEIMEYNIMATPGLLVDEKIVSKGRVPSEKEILEFLSN
ncbi:MAG: TM0996/MTH895 family glutaredoxin-like protein [Bacteroidales bacterium]|nr:TM0996/MTH895 family glutaredoxin-like protein [Bacteroidales bacterium]